MAAGPSQSGKSSFVKRLIENRNQMIFPKPARVVWCYTQQQPLYSLLRNDPEISFVRGMPDLSSLKNSIVIFDDMMEELKSDPTLSMLATRECHHFNISCIHIVQDLFVGKRTSRVNSQYIVLLKNPSDMLQVETLARQIFSRNMKYMIEAYEDSTSAPHGYLLLDLHQKTPSHFRLRTNIFPGEQTVVYTPINKGTWKCFSQF